MNTLERLRSLLHAPPLNGTFANGCPFEPAWISLVTTLDQAHADIAPIAYEYALDAFKGQEKPAYDFSLLPPPIPTSWAAALAHGTPHPAREFMLFHGFDQARTREVQLPIQVIIPDGMHHVQNHPSGSFERFIMSHPLIALDCPVSMAFNHFLSQHQIGIDFSTVNRIAVSGCIDMLSKANRLSIAQGLPKAFEFNANPQEPLLKSLTHSGWRLPFAREWEIMARAGSSHPSGLPNDFQLNPLHSEVRSSAPNAWGLYDFFQVLHAVLDIQHGSSFGFMGADAQDLHLRRQLNIPLDLSASRVFTMEMLRDCPHTTITTRHHSNPARHYFAFRLVRSIPEPLPSHA